MRGWPAGGVWLWGAPIPSAVDPGRAEQTRHRASRSFVQWRAPPGRPAPRLLHGVWVDGRRDGSWGERWGSLGSPSNTQDASSPARIFAASRMLFSSTS